MKKLYQIIVIIIGMFSLINFGSTYIANQPVTKEYIGFAYILWDYFGLAIVMIGIYMIAKLDVIRRLNKSDFLTPIDSFTFTIMITSMAFWRDHEVLPFIILVFIVYIDWINRRMRVEEREDLGQSGLLYSDRPAKIDELEREVIAKQLADDIAQNKFRSSFVLAITANWGEGKTTLMDFTINHLEQDENLIAYIFDPWYFNSQEALITNFFSSLYEKLNCNKFITNSSFVFAQYSKSLGGSGKGNIILTLLSSVISHTEQMSLLKAELSKILLKVNKRVVVFIDNIDRLDKEEILLTFKLIKLCSDFDNIMFILLFDKEQVIKKLNHNNDSDYGELYISKIIQAEMALPVIDGLLLNKYWEKILNKILKPMITSLNESDTAKFSTATLYISQIVRNIRIAKAHCNWITLKIPYYERNKLNFVDFFIIETIAYFFPDFYNKLKLYNEYIPYFTDYEVSSTFGGKDKINNDRHKIYAAILPLETIDPKTKVLMQLLGLVFKAIYNYSNSQKDYWGGEETGSFSSRPIDDKRYYLSYFTFIQSNSLSYAVRFEEVIEGISDENTYFDIKVATFTTFLSETLSQEKIFDLINQLNNIGLLSQSAWSVIITSFYQNSMLFNYDSGFFMLSDHSRVEALIARQLQSNIDDCQELFYDIAINAAELNLIRGIIYFYSANSKNEDEVLKKVKESLKHRLRSIIDGYKNIFDNPDQYRDYWCLIDYLPKQDVCEYVKVLLDSEVKNIVGFLNVFIQRSISSSDGVRYTFKEEFYNEQVHTITIPLDSLVLYVNRYTQSLKPSDPVPRSVAVFLDFWKKRNLISESTLDQ